jgi:YjbE family integral membrane protein
MEFNWAFDPSSATFWVALGKIIWINALLSGDNAVVIALACRGLPVEQRKIGMFLGAGAAIVLRIIFTIVIAYLLGVPFLTLIGALLLLYIAIELVMPKDHAESSVKASDTLMKAIVTIALADVVMSLDNVIAIAAAADGNWPLILIGLLISVPMIIAGSAILLSLIDRFPIIVWIGAAILGFVAGEMLVKDVAVVNYLGQEVADAWKVPLGIGFAIAVCAVSWLLIKAKKQKAVESAH